MFSGKTRRTRTKSLNSKVNGANAGLANAGDLYNNTSGVTTRLQREQIQQQQREQPQSTLAETISTIPMSTTLTIASTTVTDVSSVDGGAEMNAENSTSGTSFLNAIPTEAVRVSTPSGVVPSFVSCVSTPHISGDNPNATLKTNETTDTTAAVPIAAVSTTCIDNEASSVSVTGTSAESSHCDSVVSSLVSNDTTIGSINPST